MTNSKTIAVRAFATAAALVVIAPVAAQARIVRLEITQTTPAFGGRSFGATGSYERVIGKAYGEIDPQSPSNAMIQDLAAAPKNAKGMVEYSTDIDILRPADRAKSNGVLFFNILNRGNKGGIALFNADIPGGPANVGNINALTEAGDGFMQQQGYTLIWFGWQADVVAGNNRMTMRVPVATNSDGSAITGTVRNELTVLRPTTTLLLQSGWYTAASKPYPAVSTDNAQPSLMVFCRRLPCGCARMSRVLQSRIPSGRSDRARTASRLWSTIPKFATRPALDRVDFTSLPTAQKIPWYSDLALPLRATLEHF